MDKTERYERGLSKLKEIYGEQAQMLVAALGEVTPDLSRYVVEFAFGDIHCRTGLNLKSREIATLAALTALGNAPSQLRAHIGAALNVGCSQEEVVEVILQMALYAGFPATINAMQAAKEVFLARSATK
jgi:4-carboxymuconolactone decarboxylase